MKQEEEALLRRFIRPYAMDVSEKDFESQFQDFVGDNLNLSLIEEFIASTDNERIMQCFIHQLIQTHTARERAYIEERRQRIALGLAFFVSAAGYFLSYLQVEGVLQSSPWLAVLLGGSFLAISLYVVFRFRIRQFLPVVRLSPRERAR